MKKRIGYYLFLVLITPLCFEIALRLLGYSAYHQHQYFIESDPNLCMIASSDLGFALGEGIYTVSVNGAPRYSATHVNGKRITRNKFANDSLPNVFVMGCSFTYGMGVTDSISFPFQLQTTFQQLNIENFGVPGFGNVQSLLQLEREISAGNYPDLVIVNFCDFHQERNSMTPRFRNSLVMGYQRSNDEARSQLIKSRFPFYENGSVKTVGYAQLYSNWTGRETFASVNYFQTMNDDRLTSAIDLEGNSLRIFLKMKELCAKNKVQLLVTNLTRSETSKSFLRRLKKSDIDVLDISLDLQRKKYNQLPFDTHPNSRAHDHFSKKITFWLNKWISSQSHAN